MAKTSCDERSRHDRTSEQTGKPPVGSPYQTTNLNGGSLMRPEPESTGKPGEISQKPRWEGPAETRPRGYDQGEANIFADDPVADKKRTAEDYPEDDLADEERAKQEMEAKRP
jgi:hypothetical protein